MADLAVQKVLLNAFLSLPAPVLRILSGGGVVYLGGRTLDPRLQFIAYSARKAPKFSSLTPEEARAGARQAFAAVAAAPEPGVKWEAISCDGPNGVVPLRLYRPAVQDPTTPLMVYLHQGGGVIGDLDTPHAFCTILASVLKAPVISVDYRLAPEHRYPAGFEDSLAAYRWARDNADRFGAPAGRAAVGGDSMGGYFAAATCQELKRAGEPQPDLQLLIYPAVEVNSETPSMATYANTYPLSRDTMDWFMAQYLGPEDNPDDPRLSPIRAEDLSGLAPAVVVTAGFDPLTDQGEAYARRLKDAGGTVIFRCYDQLCHAFTAFTGVAPAADAACREIAGMARQMLSGVRFT